MHKWRLLLFLVLSLLQRILSEHIVIDGRQCSSHYSFSQDERFNGKYPFDKPISNTLRLSTLSENRQDDHRYGERYGENDARFSGGHHLERRIFTTSDRNRNVHERRLYRTVRDERKTFDRDLVRKQQQLFQNDAPKRDTSPYIRMSYENQEREIRNNFESNRTPLEVRRTFTKKITIQDASNIRQQRNENWIANLNNPDRSLERTARNLRIRQIVEKTKPKVNNGDMFRRNVPKCDFITDSNRDKDSDRKGLITERRERDISTKRHQEMSKLFDTNIARTQYSSKSNRINGDNRHNARYSRDDVRNINFVPSEGKTYQSNVKQIKDEHITSSLGISLKSFESNINQRQARSTPGRRINVRDEPLHNRNTEKLFYGERQSNGKISRSRTEQNNDMRRNLYGNAISKPERFITGEIKLHLLDSRRNSHVGDALRHVEPKINIRYDKTNIRNERLYSRDKNLKRDISYQRNLRLQDVARGNIDKDGARNQQTRNMYDQTDNRKQETRVRADIDKSGSIERDSRQQTSRNINVRDEQTTIRKQKRYTRDNAERAIPVESILDQQKDEETTKQNERQQRDRYVRDKRFEIKNAKSLSRYNNYDRSMAHERTVRLGDVRRVMDGQISHSQKTVNTRVLNERRGDYRNYERQSKDNNRIRINFSQRATFPHSRRISEAYDADYLTYYLLRQNPQLITEKRVNRIREKRSTDVRNERSNAEHLKDTNTERSFSADRALRQSDISRITDRQIIRSREEPKPLLERDSRYMRERTVSTERSLHEADSSRINNSAERIIKVKGERDEIQNNKRSFRNNGRVAGAFTEYGTSHRNARIRKPVALVSEERTTVLRERIDITNNEWNLRETINKRTDSSRQERQRNARITTNESLVQRKDVRIERERELTHLRDNERRSRYNTRERAVLVERQVPNLDSRSGAEAHVTKEPSRMSYTEMYSRLSIRERTSLIEKESYLRNMRTHNKATDRNTNVWNTKRFIRDNAQERVNAREMREQNSIRLTDKLITREDKESARLRSTTQIRNSTQRRQSTILYFSRSRTESSNPTFTRIDERNYLTDGNLFTRNYERSLDLYQQMESKIRTSNGNLNNIYVKHDNSRRHMESDKKRNIFGTTKAPENLSTTLFYWQYLFYAIQGIYIFGVLMQIFRQKDAKTSSMTWLAATPHVKVD